MPPGLQHQWLKFRLFDLRMARLGLTGGRAGEEPIIDEQLEITFDAQERTTWEDRFERAVDWATREAQTSLGGARWSPGGPFAEALVRIDLTGLTDGDPEVLTRTLRRVVALSRRVSARGRPGTPAICVKWSVMGRRDRALRSAVEWRWRLLDREDPRRRLPTPIVVDRGATRLLGDLPPTLDGERVARLIANRLVTYHALHLGDGPGNSPKSLGRLILRYAKLGLLRPRGWLSRNRLDEVGVDPGDQPRGNVAVYESPLAAATGEVERSLPD